MTPPSSHILILANFPPEGGWGGGVIIRSLLDHHPSQLKVYWTTFSPQDNTNLKAYGDVQPLPFKPNYLKGQSKWSVILAADAILFARKLNALIRRHHIDKLWIVLGTTDHQLYRLSKVASLLTIPFHVTVHDDPIIEIDDSKKAKATQHLGHLLRSASSVDVISHRMQQSYKQQYGIDSLVVTRGIPDTFPTNEKRIPHRLDILMAGYGNASAPWPQPLIDTIARLNTHTPTTLHLFDPKLTSYQSSTVNIYELMKESEFNAFLTRMHLGYACDDLAPANRAFAQLSLPTKIITYIGAGIPFLYHGPKDSTVGDLLKTFEAGIIVESNDANDVYAGMMTLLNNYDHYRNECLKARQNRFRQDTIQHQFYSYLNSEKKPNEVS